MFTSHTAPFCTSHSTISPSSTEQLYCSAVVSESDTASLLSAVSMPPSTMLPEGKSGAVQMFSLLSSRSVRVSTHDQTHSANRTVSSAPSLKRRLVAGAAARRPLTISSPTLP